MNSLINILTKSGLLTRDLDYHLIRASMVIIFLFFGYQQRPSYFLDVPCFRHPGSQLAFGGIGMVVWRALVPGILE